MLPCGAPAKGWSRSGAGAAYRSCLYSGHQPAGQPVDLGGCATSSDARSPDPIILLPTAHLEQLSEAELEQVLQHELAHVARRDDWIKLAQRLAEAVFWFTSGPASREAVLASGFAARPLSRRIEMLLDSRCARTRGVSGPVLLAALALLLGGLVLVSRFSLLRAAPQAKASVDTRFQEMQERIERLYDEKMRRMEERMSELEARLEAALRAKERRWEELGRRADLEKMQRKVEKLQEHKMREMEPKLRELERRAEEMREKAAREVEELQQEKRREIEPKLRELERRSREMREKMLRELEREREAREHPVI